MILRGFLLLLFSGALLFVGFWLGNKVQNIQTTFWQALVTAPEPQKCALCGGNRHHAPCLINLSTGEVGELQVYTPHPHVTGEIAEEQQTGTFNFLYCAGIMAARDTSNHICWADVPLGVEPMAIEWFCRDCRALLSGICTEGYVLADLYNLDYIQVYAITDGESYTIR
ncbi:MAG: hypothetical protein K2F83_05605, partial [Oscillospiraceae bacterium]|nr:hypothetical protein [Oscillospiraceae bacterium]